jgi:putative transposase
MANTYTQIHLQFVFATKYRDASIHPSWENELYRYITGVIQNNKHKLLCINGVTDHLHFLVGFRTHQSIADFMQDVKADSSQWINSRKFLKTRFEWQSGYGGFSYSKSMIPTIANYIESQKEHHRKRTFREEYISMLEEAGIEFDPKYIFHDPL